MLHLIRLITERDSSHGSLTKIAHFLASNGVTMKGGGGKMYENDHSHEGANAKHEKEIPVAKRWQVIKGLDGRNELHTVH